jgi:HAE1 family hydrophobic/amphiphilic exporter-1
MSEAEAIIEAGRVRFRPIVMTSLALIAGMIPIAIGLNEVSNQRRGLGMAVIGGVISSTLLALVLIPAVYSYMEKLKRFINRFTSKLVTQDVKND